MIYHQVDHPACVKTYGGFGSNAHRHGPKIRCDVAAVFNCVRQKHQRLAFLDRDVGFVQNFRRVHPCDFFEMQLVIHEKFVGDIQGRSDKRFHIDMGGRGDENPLSVHQHDPAVRDERPQPIRSHAGDIAQQKIVRSLDHLHGVEFRDAHIPFHHRGTVDGDGRYIPIRFDRAAAFHELRVKTISGGNIPDKKRKKHRKRENTLRRSGR